MLLDDAVSSIKEIVSKTNLSDSRGEDDEIINGVLGQVAVNRKKREAVNLLFLHHQNLMLATLQGKVDINQDDHLREPMVNMLRSYEERISMDCEISCSSSSPPKAAYVLIRCVRDCGSVVVPSGMISITKGSVLYVAPEDIKNLIDIGAVEILQ